MLFTSSVFLFLFLPSLLILYFISPLRIRNGILLLSSLIFYAWGELYYVALMLLSIIINYFIGLAIGGGVGNKRFGWLWVGVCANLGILISFKYYELFVETLNSFVNVFGVQGFPIWEIPLPIGISFFTFQALSYLIDVYRGDTHKEKSIVNLALYISLFPQLIAGPIVRFHDVVDQIHHRVVTLSLFFSGAQRFLFGLSKKMLVANPLGEVADGIFESDYDELSAGEAWLGVLCYSLQIYFDFSAYSDMAIGLGRMFGFRFLENFNYPYISQSIQEFWRRWHISLSRWFRDYLYIPLGGNRVSSFRMYMNLLIVFSLCGLWHGASWSFLVWGIFHGCFLIIERAGFSKVLSSVWAPVRHSYVILVIMVGWVFFRVEDLGSAIEYLKVMFYWDGLIFDGVSEHLKGHFGVCLIIGIVLSTPIARYLNNICIDTFWRGRSNMWFGRLLHMSSTVLLIGMLTILSYSAVVANSYNPFIYFRF